MQVDGAQNHNGAIPEAGPSSAKVPEVDEHDDSRRVVRPGKVLLLKLPSGTIRTIEPYATKPGKIVSLGKYGSFRMDDLIGQPFGITYEVAYDDNRDAGTFPNNQRNDNQKHPGRLVPIIDKSLEDIEETEATNELIASTGSQGLSTEDIEALKTAGRSGRDIIEAQINAHSAYDLKTEYSKHKYRQKKEKKYLSFFTPLLPSTHSLADTYFSTNPSKTFDIRTDTLSQMLSLGNICPGSRVLIVESSSGLLTGAVVERLGGVGSCAHIHEHVVDPTLTILDEFRFSKKDTENVLSFLNWAHLEKDFNPHHLPTEPKDGAYKNYNEKVKYEKRREHIRKLEANRENFWRGEWDALLIASTFEPSGILRKLKPYLAGSAQVVMYHPVLQVAEEFQKLLKQDMSFIADSLTSSFLRKYQVLPGRTHPEMQGSAGSGYLVHAVRVFG